MTVNNRSFADIKIHQYFIQREGKDGHAIPRIAVFEPYTMRPPYQKYVFALPEIVFELSEKKA